MSRIKDRYCSECGSIMRRMYVRPPNWQYQSIGFVCACEHVTYDWSPSVKKWVGDL